MTSFILEHYIEGCLSVSILLPVIGILVLLLVCLTGVVWFKFTFLFGVVFPYAASFIFISGCIYRVVIWARSPVPFCIPTVCGQQRSLLWIKSDKVQSPFTSWGLIRRMASEIVFFRSLFRNDKTELKKGQILSNDASRLLWLGGLVFHWSIFIILVRHLKLFVEPVPRYTVFLQNIDGMFQFGSLNFYLTDVFILLSLLFLLLRRIVSSRMRLISIFTDYFALYLILAILVSGVLMKYVYKADVMSIKRMVMGMLAFKPFVIADMSPVFYVHIFFVCVLLIYFPFSKLMHLGGVFLSPTRNLKNDSRAKRHVNPWDYPVKVHTYEEWENEFRSALKEAGLPVEKRKIRKSKEDNG